jgi:hypothetical protein
MLNESTAATSRPVCSAGSPSVENGRRPWLRFTCARIYIKEKKMTNDKIFFRIVSGRSRELHRGA